MNNLIKLHSGSKRGIIEPGLWLLAALKVPSQVEASSQTPCLELNEAVRERNRSLRGRLSFTCTGNSSATPPSPPLSLCGTENEKIPRGGKSIDLFLHRTCRFATPQIKKSVSLNVSSISCQGATPSHCAATSTIGNKSCKAGVTLQTPSKSRAVQLELLQRGPQAAGAHIGK